MYIITDELIYIPDTTEYRIARVKGDNTYSIIAETPSKVYTIIDGLGTKLDESSADCLTDIVLDEIKDRAADRQNIDLSEIYEYIGDKMSRLLEAKEAEASDENE